MSGEFPAPPALDPARAALFCDLDGTLAEIRQRPGDVGPDPRRAAVLAEAERRLGGALAIVSGRALNDLDRILGGRTAALAAVHGLVRRRADGVIAPASAEPLPAWVGSTLGEFQAAHPGVLIEDKTVSIAVHFRAAPAAAKACEAVALDLARRAGLVVQPGDMVVELRVPGPTKADAVAAFMAEPPFAGRVPVFVGDDLTDEDGFAGAEGFGGYGVIVGARRPTRARYGLPSVTAALDWLAG